MPYPQIGVDIAELPLTASTTAGNSIRERGLPADTYYLVFTGDDYSYRLVFEERP
jgi:hypothetical protein